MKILSASVRNFASYKELEFEFDNQGLCLISGPTGSGKSTLCDLIPWCLFATTAKGGLADEVISWNAEGLTKVTAWLDSCVITRVRGKKSNDLYYQLPGEVNQRRGKDIPDTQRLINDLLGLNAELYLSGAYFHEFSAASTFFIANAKLRRQITEQMVDLSLAKTLTERSSDYKKSLKAEINDIKINLKSKQDKLDYLKGLLSSAKECADTWEEKQKQRIALTKKRYEDFEQTKIDALDATQQDYEDAKLENLGSIEALEKQLKTDAHFKERQHSITEALKLCSDAKCPTCGNTKSNSNKMILMKRQQELDNEISNNNFLKRDISRYQQNLDKLETFYTKNIEEINSRVNTYGEQLKQLKAERNPHKQSMATTARSIDETLNEINNLEADLTDFQVELSDVELLVDVIAAFRAELIKSAIIELQTNTNNLLTKHFDSEIRVSFDIAEADKLEVTITKDGNTASYTQLSKGQRQLLKLCYGISVMKAVSNHHGIKFNAIFLDEFADGLSEELKVKTYGLLQQLATEHDSVFVVEHSQELKARFSKRYDVTLVNGESQIEET